MDKKNTVLIDDDCGLDERISNTASLLAEFAKENLDEKTADEILSILDGIDKKDNG